MKHKKIQLKTIVITLIILIILVLSVLFFSGKFATNKKVASDSNSSSQVVKTKKADITVSETQKNARMSAAVIGLYGADNMHDTTYWAPVKAGLTNKTATLHVTNGSDKNVQYKYTTDLMNDIHQVGYYELSGQNHDTVEFYAAHLDGSTQHFKDVQLSDVLDYVNRHYDRSQLDNYAKGINISDEMSGNANSSSTASSSASASSNDVTEADDNYTLKAAVYYGIMNSQSNGLWQSYQNVLKNNKGATFICRFDGASEYTVALSQAGGVGAARFHYEGAHYENGVMVHPSTFAFWTESPDQNDMSKTKREFENDALLPISTILDFANKAGGKKMLDTYNFQIQ